MNKGVPVPDWDSPRPDPYRQTTAGVWDTVTNQPPGTRPGTEVWNSAVANNTPPPFGGGLYFSISKGTKPE